MINTFKIILSSPKILKLTLSSTDVRKPIIWSNGMDNTGFRGSLHVRRGQWDSTHVFEALLRGCLRRPDAGNTDDDTNFQADTYARRNMHGKSFLFLK